MKKRDFGIISVVTIFAVAMAFLESTVVVYLRKLYYENGFDFPLKGFIEPQILNIEWVREFFTIVMLLCVGYLAGKKFNERFAYFLYSFAVWDIFYYVWLKVMLDWPASLMTWDLLFLIPWPWAGPVLAPIICSLTMTWFAFCLIEKKNRKIKTTEWILLFAGGFVILYTFVIDYGALIVGGNYLKDFLTLATNAEFSSIISSYVPSFYNWLLFWLGEISIIISISMFCFRKK
ncbi:hypothetical protein JXB27_02550 [Candidatus Woesearchaeota archaeon]|nr:hypothetical protein [Candidatus Woesearchaeota archaeon]